MAKVTFDYSKAESFISNDEVNSMKEIAENAKKVLVERTGAGNDFLGWIDLPVDYDKEEFDRIKKAAAKIQSDSEVLIVIGIGGSYLGARAAIEFLRHGFYNNVPKEVRKTPEIYYAGSGYAPRGASCTGQGRPLRFHPRRNQRNHGTQRIPGRHRPFQGRPRSGARGPARAGAGRR